MFVKRIIYLVAVAVIFLAGCTPSQPQPGQATTALVITAASLPGGAPEKTPLRVFCAGSLIVPFEHLEKAFEARHPEVDVQNECHGSIQVIRHVTELHEEIDVVATADHALIPMLMYNTRDEAAGQPYANWYIRFAANRMALAYSAHSRYADQITPENWYMLLAEPEVQFGLADPRFDAAGYRALMTLRLAEDAYQHPGILKSMLEGRFQFPITIFEEDDFTEIGVPEVLEPLPSSGIVLRGASIQLIALLESGDLDYAFEYESVIRQHNLQWVALPEDIHLGDSARNEVYGRVQVEMNFQRFASVKPVFRGEQIGYGITIPSNAPHPELAAQFVAFLLDAEGRVVMEADFQPLLAQPVCDQPQFIPQILQAYCQKETP